MRRYIGAYVAAMGGLALQNLSCMGIALDEQRNREARGLDEVCRISSDDSTITVLIVPADEERMMVREALRALSRSYLTGVLEVQKQEPFLVEVSAHHTGVPRQPRRRLFPAQT